MCHQQKHETADAAKFKNVDDAFLMKLEQKQQQNPLR